MIHLFAQVVAHAAEAVQTSDYDAPMHWAEFSACVFFSLGIAGAIKYLLPSKEKKVVPQPLVVTSHPSYADKLATEARFQLVESKVEQSRVDLETKIESSRVENKTEMDKLRDEGAAGRRLLHQDINNVPAKVIQLLRDTKDLL